MSKGSSFPGRIIVKLGIFPTMLDPEMEAFVSQRVPWIKPLEGCVQYKNMRGGELMDQ